MVKETKKKGKSSNDINSIDKILNVIECIFKEKEISFTEIKEELNIPKSTLHRILLSLEKRGYISRNDVSDKYSLGVKFIYYGETIKSNLTLSKISESILKDLANEIGETVNIGILYNDSVLNILSVKGEESVLTSKLIPISPLNCSSIGKIFLAIKNDIELITYFSGNNYEKRTENSICTLDKFKVEQNSILNSQISFDDEEYEYGLFCIATPLKNHNGIINAAVSITGPKVRMKMKNIDLIQKKLIDKTSVINDILIKIKFDFNY